MADSGFCPRCGSARVPGQGFCTKCGMRFDTEGAPAGPPSGSPMVPPPPPPPSGAYQQPAYQPPPAAYPQPAQTYQQPAYQQAPAYQQPAYQAAPASRGSVSMGGLNVRLLPLLGAAMVAIGALLPWFQDLGGGSSNALDLPVKFLFDPEGTSEPGGFSVGIVLLVLGIGGAILTFMPGTATIRRIVGSVAALVVVVLIFQVIRLFGELDANVMDVITEVLSFGVYVSLVGGVLLSATK